MNVNILCVPYSNRCPQFELRHMIIFLVPRNISYYKTINESKFSVNVGINL